MGSAGIMKFDCVFNTGGHCCNRLFSPMAGVRIPPPIIEFFISFPHKVLKRSGFGILPNQALNLCCQDQAVLLPLLP